jgi:hypothetical protein
VSNVDKVGLIGVDVGVTTGIAWGIFNPALRDELGLWKALARGRRTGFAEVPMGSGQAFGLEACNVVMDKAAEFNIAGIRLDINLKVIVEDFQVRRDLRGGTARDKLAPVFMAGMMHGIFVATGKVGVMEWVSPSMSKALASDSRLKDWAQIPGVRGRMGWIRGKKHARDACRLLAVGLEQMP